MGECHHEMPGLPYPAFRRVNVEPGGGPSVDGSPYTLRDLITRRKTSLMGLFQSNKPTKVNLMVRFSSGPRRRCADRGGQALFQNENG
jgi:hypothetical protein